MQEIPLKTSSKKSTRRKIGVLVVCKKCGLLYWSVKAKQKYCSRSCASSSTIRRKLSDVERTERKKINRKSLYTRNREAWLVYFESVYGVFTTCQVCGNQIAFRGGCKKNGVVQFDHKHHDLATQETPANWYTKRVCNEKNIQIWNEQNFGLLCGACNGNLPTEGREEWLLKALEYTRR